MNELVELKTFITKSGNRYNFVCSCNTNRSGFVHKCWMFVNDRFKSDCKCQYYNRTWEPYCYYTVMLGAIQKVKEREYDKLKNEFKTINNYKVITKKRREELKKYISEHGEKLDELYEIYGLVERR